jgi:hypothetical protein
MHLSTFSIIKSWKILTFGVIVVVKKLRIQSTAKRDVKF